MPETRVMVFIDGSNLYHGLKRNGRRTDVDFGKLGKLLTGSDRRLIRVYYYNVAVPPAMDDERARRQQAFLSRVRQQEHVRVVLGRLEPRGDTWIEKGVDTQIAVDMLRHASTDTFDAGILVSGDGDLACVLEAVGDLGKNVENAYFTDGRSQQLSNCSDRFDEITPQMLDACHW